jgi:hypothetical protein
MGEIILSVCVGLSLVFIGVQVLWTVKRDEKVIQGFLENESEEVR